MKCSIVQFSELDKIVFRFDAEFYHPEYLILKTKLERFNSVSLRNLGGDLDCSAFYPSIVSYYNFEKTGIPFLRVNEIQDALLHISSNTAFLPPEIISENSSTIACCKPGDLIIAKGGNSLGKVALVTNEYQKYSVCRDVLIIRTQDLLLINPYYLWMFFHSKIGQKSLLRTASQTGQPHLTLEAISQMEIPLFNEKFQQCFEFLYKKSQALKFSSRKIYKDSEDFLLSEINLNNWQAKHQLTFIKNYSNAKESERIDPDYYQPKYEEIVNSIKNYHGGWDTLENLIVLKDKNFNPQKKVIYKYIELANISGNGEITDCMIGEEQDLPTRAGSISPL